MADGPESNAIAARRALANGPEAACKYRNFAIYRYVLWRVEALDESVVREIEALPADMQARFLRIAERVRSIGLANVGEPHVKHIEGKLWEIRMSGRDGIGRAIYVAATGRRVVVLHAFMKKTQKTPRSAIELALARAKRIQP